MSETFSSPDDFLLESQIFPINSSHGSKSTCLITKPSSLIMAINLMIKTAVLFPLCIFILYHGVQERQRRRSTSSAASMSHCDCFTYHMVVMELIGISGCLMYCCGIFREAFEIIEYAFFPFAVNYFGKALFHVLTCVERYLAVVHPITYLSLRQEKGVRIRNIIIGCVWLSCFGLTGVLQIGKTVTDFSIMISALVVISFCSLSVLCTLVRPSPGEQNGDRKMVDRSKQRAFYTIVFILVALLLKFTLNLIWATTVALDHDVCIIQVLDVWFNFPSSLALPLMFLYRTGKFKYCNKNSP